MGKLIIAGFVACLFAIAFAWQMTPPISACVPNDEDPSRCIVWRPHTKTPTTRSTPKPVAQATPVAAPRPHGGGPGDALVPDDMWRTIDAYASAWYQIGEGINPQHLEVWLDAWGKDGITFVVYSPDQMNGWAPDVPPKGRGTPNRADTRHDLWWIGQAPAGGTWFVIVTNHNSVPLPYRVGYNRVAMTRRDCGQPYWETLFGQPVLWPGYCKPDQ